MSLLLRRSGCRRLGRWRSRFAGRGRRRWLHRLGSRAARSGCRYAGLNVVGVDDWLRDVHGRSVPDHRAARPLLGRVQDHAIAVIAGVLHYERRHLGENFIPDLALLILEIFLRVLGGAIVTFLLGLDLLAELGEILVGLLDLVLDLAELLGVVLVAVGLALLVWAWQTWVGRDLDS